MVGGPAWRSLGLGLAAAGCAAGARRAEGVSAPEVKSSWRIPLGDAPHYAEEIAWAPDSRRLAVGGVRNKRMSVWDVRSLRRLPAPGDQAGGVVGLAYSPDGRYLGVARGSTVPGEWSAVSIWDGQSGSLIQSLVEAPQELDVSSVGSLAFGLDSRYLAVAYSPRSALYASDGSKWARTATIGPGAYRVAFSPDGTSVALFGISPHRILICRVPTMEVLRNWPTVGGPGWGYPTLAYRPSGGQVAAGYGPDLGIFDPGDGELLAQVTPDPPIWIRGLAYSPDGRILAASVGRTVRLLDSESWSLFSKLEPESRGTLHDVAYSPDGTMLAAAAGPEVIVWEFSK